MAIKKETCTCNYNSTPFEVPSNLSWNEKEVQNVSE